VLQIEFYTYLHMFVVWFETDVMALRALVVGGVTVVVGGVTVVVGGVTVVVAWGWLQRSSEQQWVVTSRFPLPHVCVDYCNKDNLKTR